MEDKPEMRLCGEQEEGVSSTARTGSRQGNEAQMTWPRSNAVGGSRSPLAKHAAEALTTDLHPYQASDRFMPLFERSPGRCEPRNEPGKL